MRWWPSWASAPPAAVAVTDAADTTSPTTGAGADAGTGDGTPPTGGEGTAAGERPALAEGSCALDDEAVAALLGDGVEVPEPTVTHTTGGQIFLEDLVNTDTMILGDLSTCVWDPPDTTAHVATYVAFAPGDQYTPADELGALMLERLRAPFEPTDGAAPVVQGEVTEPPGVGDAAVLVETEVGSITWLGAHRGGILAVVATIATDVDTGALTDAVESLLDGAADAAATGGEVSTTTTGPAGDGDEPVSGTVVTTGELAATWRYRPGGAFSCSGGIEVPLAAEDGSAVGYLEATPDGELTFGSGKLGASALRGTGTVSGYDPTADAPQVTIEVDGELSDGSTTLDVQGTLEVRCP